MAENVFGEDSISFIVDIPSHPLILSAQQSKGCALRMNSTISLNGRMTTPY